VQYIKAAVGKNYFFAFCALRFNKSAKFYARKYFIF